MAEPLLDTGSDLGGLELGFAGLGLGPQTTDPNYGAVFLQVLANGVDVATLTEVHLARVATGWSQAASEARATLTSRPTSITYGNTVEVWAGRGTNNVQRFSGIVRDWDYSLWPKAVVLIARSELCKLEDVSPRSADVDMDPLEGQPGIDLETLLGTPNGGTLRQIVTAILNYAGVTLPTFVYDPSHVYGAPAGFPENFTWRAKETAMEYLHRLFEATCGARLFTSGDGQHYLAQIVGRPRAAPDLGLAEGYDILDGATGNRSTVQTRNAVRVFGADDGTSGGDPLADVIESNDFQTAADPRYKEVNSNLIEDAAWALEIANYWLQELNRELVGASIPTWHDEPQGPAQTHLIDSPRIGIQEPAWVLDSEMAVDAKSFTITNKYVGGGIAVESDRVPV